MATKKKANGVRKRPKKPGKKRNYPRETALFHSKRSAKDARNNSNKARRRAGLKPGDAREVDHIVPQSKGGSNKPSNVRIVTKRRNRTRGNKRS